MSELEACRSEGRNYSSEVYRLKASYDETMEQLDVVRRENKNLADEIKCVSSLCIKTSKCFTSHYMHKIIFSSQGSIGSTWGRRPLNP